MTPTIFGRWQTRLLLMGTVGVFVTLFFARWFNDFVTPFVLLGYATLIGCYWDMFYNFTQTLRWDRDWPPIFFVGAAIVEALFLWGLINLVMVWQPFGWQTLPGISTELAGWQFLVHYITVWLTTYLIMLGPIKIAFIQWRFRGGRIAGGR